MELSIEALRMFRQECEHLAAMERDRANELAEDHPYESAIHHQRALYFTPTMGIA